MSFTTKIIDFVKSKQGSKYADGECWSLSEGALKHVNAKTSRDYFNESGGKEADFANADYVWGKLIGITELQVGDFVQFKNHKFRVDMKDGAWSTFSRPHHSAIIKSVPNNYSIEVYEQNVGQTNQDKNVTVRLVYIANISDQGDIKRTNVTGSSWFYRPQPRQSQ